MEIPAWLFITFWAVISITFLHLGFHALEKTELSNSVPPLVMFLFKHSLAVSSCFSSSYALKFRSQSNYPVRSNFMLLVYVFFSIVFRRTIEGILIWHVVKPIFAWLLNFSIELGNFFEMIFLAWNSLLLSLFPFLWRFLLCMVLIFAVLAPFYSPIFSIFRIILYLATGLFIHVVYILIRGITYFVFTWFFTATESFWNYIGNFIGICTAIAFSCFLCFCIYNFLLHCKNNFSELKTRAGILLVLEISLFFASVEKRSFSPVLALSISHFFSVFYSPLSRWFGDHTIISDGERLEGWMILSMLKEHKVKKFIEFAVGTVGAVLFQNFFKITSFDEVAAFLYLAVMWLGNLVLLGFSCDFGVFNFLLVNAMVGCTVGEFGLHGVTWVAVGSAFVLYGLRLILEFCMVTRKANKYNFLFLERTSPQPNCRTENCTRT